MCVGCIAVSALTFLIPVSEAPVNTAQNPLPSQSAIITQVSPQELAAIGEIQKTLRAITAELPQTAETAILRQGFEQAARRLSTVTQAQQAQDILDEEMGQLATAVSAAPNSQALFELVWEIRDRVEYQDIPAGQSAPSLQSSAATILLRKGLSLQQHSGWLS